MALNKEETDVLKVVVEKELKEVSEKGKDLLIVNSPFFNKVGDLPDLPFLRDEKIYEEFLKDLLSKL